MASMQERVAERYPDLVPLLKQPEIGSLLTRAVTENWSPGVFRSKFIASNWFRTQPESSRRWWVLKATDPGEATRQRRAIGAEIGTLSRSLGVPLNTPQLKWVTESALQRGLSPDSAELRGELINFMMKYTAPGAGHILPQGALRTTAKQITGMARFNYGLPGNETWIRARTKDVVMGSLSMDDVENELRELAAKRFPHMQEGLQAGQSVADIMAPYAEIYAAEMDMQPQEVLQQMFRDTDKVARQMMGVRDAKTGKTRLPTEVEAMRLARSQDKWWGTSGGRQQDAGMSTFLLQQLGVRK